MNIMESFVVFTYEIEPTESALAELIMAVL